MATRKILQKGTIYSAVIYRPIGNVRSIIRNSIYAFDAAKLSQVETVLMIETD